MEKKKKRALIIGIVFLVFILFVILYLVIVYKNGQNEMRSRMKEVEAGYTTFKNHITDYNNARDAIYKEAMQDMLYTTLKEKDAANKLLFQTYEGTVTLLDEDYKKLKDKCMDVLYPNVSVNNKCEAFLLGYEEAINTYVMDIENYNKNIDSYNTYLKDTNNAVEVPLVKLEKKKDYIDVDGNHIYQGKDEEKKTNEK